jgi:Ca-activated chloride channel family protein
MKFLWPSALWLLAALPLLVALYIWLLRRKKTALRLASLAIVKGAMAPGARWRRHVPPAVLLLSLAALIIGIARPTAVVTLPSQQQTVILAMDVSGSMRATDVQPSRLVASQNAAKAFIADVRPETRVGIVTFAGSASVVMPPTNNKEDLYAAIDRFQLQRATAIGSGLIISLATIFPDAGITLDSVSRGGRHETFGRPLADPSNPKPEEKPFAPVPPGSYTSAAIILLTDGARTTGPDPLEAARMAADRGIKVFTIGFGTKDGEIIGFEGWSMRVRLDEDSLKSIASLTHGEYFWAGSEVDLKKIYETLNARLVFERKETEVTAFFTALGALLALLAAGLSVWWFNRIV